MRLHWLLLCCCQTENQEERHLSCSLHVPRYRSCLLSSHTRWTEDRQSEHRIRLISSRGEEELVTIIHLRFFSWHFFSTPFFFLPCDSFQLRHWLHHRPHLHAALRELLCDHVRRLLCHSAPHHRGGVRDLQCGLAVRSRQVSASPLFTLLAAFCGTFSSSVTTGILPHVSSGSLMTLRPC